MSTSIIIISAILVACLILPVYLFNKNSTNNTSKTHKSHELEMNKHNLKLTEKEEWGNSFIGIDTDQSKLLFSKTIMNADEATVIALAEIKRCNVLKSVKTIKTKGKSENLLEKVALEFIYTKNGLPNLTLEFYDAEGDYREDFEMKRAEKWAGIINQQLATAMKPSMVA